MSKNDDPLAILPPDVQAQVLKSQQAFKIAKEIDQEIVKSGIKVDELSVAYAAGDVALSGYVNSVEDKDKIHQIAQKHPEVKEVLNNIVVE